MTNSTHTEQYAQEAYELGRQHAINAASWIIDGNTKREFIPAVLEMMDAGDPAVEDYLPARPNLSGEWADDPTPATLVMDIAGPGKDDGAREALVDALCDAYERGVGETFDAECERILRQTIS